MTRQIPIFFYAILLGVIGTGHCLGMCGGLIGALTLAIKKQKRISILLAYNLGRILSYTMAGLIFGIAGFSISKTKFSPLLSIIPGILLISMGFYLVGFWNVLTYLEIAGKIIWKYIKPAALYLVPINNIMQALLLGALWGWLPCGLVYTTLIWASSQGNILDSAILMFLFGIGTCPILLITGITADKIHLFFTNRGIRIMNGIMIICFGILSFPFINKLFFNHMMHNFM